MAKRILSLIFQIFPSWALNVNAFKACRVFSPSSYTTVFSFAKLYRFIVLTFFIACFAFKTASAEEGFDPFNSEARAFTLNLFDLLAPYDQEDQALPASQLKKKLNNALPDLFEKLTAEIDPKAAFKLAKQIQKANQATGSETCDLLFFRSGLALASKQNSEALDFLDNLLALKPNFSEAWLRRAFIHVQNYDMYLAMADLAQALKYNPNNFYALALLGGVLEQNGEDKLALKAYEKALALYPQWPKLQLHLMFLIEKKTPVPV